MCILSLDVPINSGTNLLHRRQSYNGYLSHCPLAVSILGFVTLELDESELRKGTQVENDIRNGEGLFLDNRRQLCFRGDEAISMQMARSMQIFSIQGSEILLQCYPFAQLLLFRRLDFYAVLE